MCTDSDAKAPRQPHFTALPVDLFRLIISLLYDAEFDSFLSLRLVSRVFRDESEIFLYRTLTLNDKVSRRFRCEYLMNRLKDQRDMLAIHVRHLCIGPFDYEENLPSEKALRVALSRFENLRSVSWNTWIPIPPSVLESLNSKWPSARLHVKNTSRNFEQMDKKLLSSPQLYSLDYIIYRGIQERKSELPALKKCLMRGKNLKALNLNFTQTNFINRKALFPQREDVGEGPLNFDFKDGEVFPNLESLTLQWDQYDLSPLHCQQWIRAMDFRALRHLNVGQGAPCHFFSALTGQVPNLKTLRFGLFDNYKWPNNIWHCPDLSIVGRFLSSINGLEDVEIVHFKAKPLNVIWPTFLSKHGPTLKRLNSSYAGSMEGHQSSVSWTANDFHVLRRSAPEIQSLEATVALEGKAWSRSITEALIPFDHLRKVKLRVQIKESQGGHTTFCIEDGSKCYFNVPTALHVATSLLEEWVTSNPISKIETLNIVFKSSYMHVVKEWPIEIERVRNQDRWKIAKGSTSLDSAKESLYPERREMRFYDPWG